MWPLKRCGKKEPALAITVEACHWPESFGHLDMTTSWYGKRRHGQLQLHNKPTAAGQREAQKFLDWKNNSDIKSKQAICDVAAIVSRQCISGASLSRARLLNQRYAALRYHSGQYCPQYLLAGLVEYGISFATFEPLDAEALGFLHDSLKRMWRAEKDKREVSEGKLSASSSETSSDKAMISFTFPQSVLQQMRPGGGEVQGSSAAAENPANSLRSMLVSFASGHSEDGEDDNSRQTEESQVEEAPPQRAWGSSTFGIRRKRKATSASKTSRAEEVLKEGATAGKMMFSIWNLLSNLFISVSLPSLAKIYFLPPRNCLHPGRT